MCRQIEVIRKVIEIIIIFSFSWTVINIKHVVMPKSKYVYKYIAFVRHIALHDKSKYTCPYLELVMIYCSA